MVLSATLACMTKTSKTLPGSSKLIPRTWRLTHIHSLFDSMFKHQVLLLCSFFCSCPFCRTVVMVVFVRFYTYISGFCLLKDDRCLCVHQISVLIGHHSIISRELTSCLFWVCHGPALAIQEEKAHIYKSVCLGVFWYPSRIIFGTCSFDSPDPM